MSEQPDLRALADVDDADVVRAAASHFRRRVLVRSLWLLLVIAGAAVIVLGYKVDHEADLSLKITRSQYLGILSPRSKMVGNVSVTAVANRMSDGRLGLNISLDPPQTGKEVLLVIPAPPPTQDGGQEATLETEAWKCPGVCRVAAVVQWPEDGVVSMYLIHPDPGGIEPFTLDLKDFVIPPESDT